MSAVAQTCQNRPRNLMERRVLLAVSLGLVLTATQACKRSEALKRNDTLTGMSGENLPFHEEPVAGAGDPGAVLSSVKRSALPFPTSSQPRFLAAGTLVTVQLRESLSTARAHAGEQFAAVVTTPLDRWRRHLVKSGTRGDGAHRGGGVTGGQSGRAPGSGILQAHSDCDHGGRPAGCGPDVQLICSRHGSTQGHRSAKRAPLNLPPNGCGDARGSPRHNGPLSRRVPQPVDLKTGYSSPKMVRF